MKNLRSLFLCFASGLAVFLFLAGGFSPASAGPAKGENTPGVGGGGFAQLDGGELELVHDYDHDDGDGDARSPGDVS